ncbi:MAG: fructose-6-phosphate aldolase [Elusimicrobiota bacterium]|jgi:TalC/MipB family fructose-6-phosphate aldolase|nr:fructose-6-phosphate aldolase [Elusimicrobiota bacterium]
MEFLIDTANLEEIKKGIRFYPISGLTSNPSILKREGKINFFEHLKKIREIITDKRSLHVQVIAEDADGILKDAKAILKNVDKDVFIKIPVTPAGLSAMQILKQEGINVTATAVYSLMQGYLALACGVDYIVAYFNRMENLNIEPTSIISALSEKIYGEGLKSKVMGASYKNVRQVNQSFEAGASSATVDLSILETVFAMPSISKAVNDFSKDWVSVFGNKTIAEL